MAKKSDLTGGAGMKPPADAPVETTQPLKTDAGGIVVHDPVTGQPTGEIITPRERARQNERTLAPLKAPGKPLTAVGASPTPPVVHTPTAAEVAEFFGSDSPVITPTHPSVAEPPQPVPTTDFNEGADLDPAPELPPLSAEDRARMPAASDTDSPSSGLLPNLTPPTGDKFAGISRGGFSDMNEDLYFPLNGDEVRELVLAQFDTLAAQMRNDMRFGMALTYPRAKVTVSVTVEGHVEDANVDGGVHLTKIYAPKEGTPGGTPLDIANRKADSVVFVIRARKQEFTDAGDIDSPPDAIRDQLGLDKPRMQHTLDVNGLPVFFDL